MRMYVTQVIRAGYEVSWLTGPDTSIGRGCLSQGDTQLRAIARRASQPNKAPALPMQY